MHLSLILHHRTASWVPAFAGMTLAEPTQASRGCSALRIWSLGLTSCERL